MQIVIQLHQAGILHCDLTQDTIGLRESRSSQFGYQINKIGGFDYACINKRGQSMADSYENNWWMAPEVRDGSW